MADGFITRRGGPSSSAPPVFTYTGEYTPIDDGDGNWRIKFYTSGTLTFTDLGNAANGIDVFLVGGGGSGASLSGSVAGAGGGGGGYTTTGTATLTKGTDYIITIGAGGIGAALSSAGKNGGTTSAFNLTAKGGYGAGVQDGQKYYGGDGGSGGGGAGSNGGSNGSNSSGDYPALGQGTTTREFGEDTGDLYAGGGGAAPTYYNSWGSNWLGGAGGGGDGSYCVAGTQSGAYDFLSGYPGVDGLGGGGGGGRGNGGDGGSGIVIIRNKR